MLCAHCNTNRGDSGHCVEDIPCCVRTAGVDELGRVGQLGSPRALRGWTRRSNEVIRAIVLEGSLHLLHGLWVGTDVRVGALGSPLGTGPTQRSTLSQLPARGAARGAARHTKRRQTRTGAASTNMALPSTPCHSRTQPRTSPQADSQMVQFGWPAIACALATRATGPQGQCGETYPTRGD